ncbi:MAG: hypothetical protein Q3959_03855 [Limosilactobacillus sp.]|uniref:hypothetical protein n=1 Tax=Limosilactobacillus sp. TaxID=2773925 RepID=UPI0026FA0103|nr:hypothetical protein [Limosilactobacillus sp.]
MTTRSEMNQGVKATPKKKRHIPVDIIIGIVLMFLFMSTFILNQTIFNTKFVTNEITSSNVESSFLKAANPDLGDGISTDSLMTKSEANMVFGKLVEEAFAGEKLTVDLTTPIENAMSEGASNSDSTGFASAIVSTFSGAIAKEVNSKINSEINTPEVTKLVKNLHTAKMASNGIMIGCGIALLIMIVLSLIGKYFLAVFSWVTTISWLLTFGFVYIIKGILPNLVKDYPDYSSLMAQVSTDFYSKSWTWLLIFGAVAIVLWILRFIRSRVSSR